MGELQRAKAQLTATIAQMQGLADAHTRSAGELQSLKEQLEAVEAAEVSSL